ncbi:M1 family metallopeptidase [Runella limosa]|uniref:M1 family metallopeptidase n=1 Tax=Runella limosa TaxID=370978 RepID=UPI0004071413|nr:M1 family metallopeptidase [Runella limosa]
MKIFRLALLFSIVHFTLFAQKYTFTHDDTLRGSITKERAWWDLQFYHLNTRINPADSTIGGHVVVRYKVLQPAQMLQIDLQRPLTISKITQDGQELSFRRDGDAFFVSLVKPQKTDAQEEITVHYGGRPRIAKRAPWDGGFSWKRDQNGQPFVATSCQGLGASVWWPCKDHMYDEPDSMKISITVPPGLTDVSNGRLSSISNNADGWRTFHWYVQNPINNYGVNVNIGNYVSWTETFEGEKGKLDLSFYALPENAEKAKAQFQQVRPMLKAFEHWFGPYPFYEDGFKLVEVPYLGMEHQSSVTYGNGYQNGYLGRDLSATGWGLKWDFIIIHESGHEWFANNITYKDVADMWIHESFTNYSENLYTEYHHGKQAGAEYVIGCRKLIRNDKPIIGVYGVNHSGSGDMYYKGGNMLHTIRQIVNDDEKWRGILRGLNKTFYHQTVTSPQIEDYMSAQAGVNLSKVFDQYLRDVRIPTLEYKLEGKQLSYRWSNCVAGFEMPVKLKIGDNWKTLQPTSDWKTLKVSKASAVMIDPNFYVEIRKLE